MKSWGTAGFAVLVVTLVAAIGVLFVATQQRADDGAASAADAPPLRNSLADRPELLVVGDSFTEGSDMNIGPEWPDLIAEQNDWTLDEDAAGGTGYVKSTDIDPAFAGRVAETVDTFDPDLVIVAGGINDVGVASDESIAQAARQEVLALQQGFPDAEVVLFSNFASGEPDAPTRAVTDVLRGAADQVGVEFVDVSGFLPERLVGEDDVHPTDMGHLVLARRIDNALTRLGYVERLDEAA